MAKRRRNRPARRDGAENPSVPLSVDAWNEDASWAFSGGTERSASGVRVTRRRVLGYPAVWRAVNLIAGAVAKLPLLVYRVDGRNRDPDQGHPAHALLRWRPNDLTTAFHFKQTLMGHALIEGNGYAYVVRAGAVPTGLVTLDPTRVEPVLYDGRLWYVYDRQAGGGFENIETVCRVPAADVLHVRGLGFDGIRGYPVLYVLRDAFGGAIAARDHSARYFKNKAMPGGALRHPQKLSDQARRNMRDSWERLHSGLSNAHRVAILEEGTEYVPFQSDARSAQLLESREFDSREVANIFGVPAHKLGDPSKVAYNSLEQENQSFYDDTLSHWLECLSQECRDKLLSEAEKATHDIGFDYRELQRANLAALTAFAEKGLQNEFLSPDEARGLFDLNPRPDGMGGEYGSAPRAALPLAPAADDGAAVRAALRPVVEDVGRRVCRRLARVWERHGAIAEWESHVAPVADMLAPLVVAAGRADAAAALAARFVGDYVAAATSADAVRRLETVAPAGLADYLLRVKA